MIYKTVVWMVATTQELRELYAIHFRGIINKPN